RYVMLVATRLAYSAYGLRVEADAPVPGLATQSTPGAADIELTLEGIPAHLERLTATGAGGRERTPTATISWSAHRDFVGISYADGCRFVLSTDGRRAWIDWPRTLTVRDVLPYLRGPIFGAILRLRNRVCLHGSALKVGDGAIVLVGPPGSGKSTTAA